MKPLLPPLQSPRQDIFSTNEDDSEGIYPMLQIVLKDPDHLGCRRQPISTQREHIKCHLKKHRRKVPKLQQ